MDLNIKNGNKELVRRLCWFNCIKENVLFQLKTQHHSIYHQLILGCRIFDLKIVKIDHVYYVANIFCCEILENVIEEVIYYFNKNPGAHPITLLVTAGGDIGNELLLAAFISIRIMPAADKILCFCKFKNTLIFELFKNIENYDSLDHLFITSEEKMDEIFEMKKISRYIVHLAPAETQISILGPRRNIESVAAKLNAVAAKKVARGENLPFAILIDFADKDIIKKFLINEHAIHNLPPLFGL